MKIDKQGTVHIDSAIVGELTYGALHSLNNLLQGIVGLAELLDCNPNLPADAKSDSNAILELAQNASDLVKKIKQASRIEPAKPEKAVVEAVPEVEVLFHQRDLTDQAGLAAGALSLAA